MKPQNIFLIRHGESLGNESKTTYHHTPDHAIALTVKGIEQALDAGSELAKTILPLKYKNNKRNWAVYYSPYVRSIETTENIIESYNNSCKSYFDRINQLNTLFREEPRIRELEYGTRLENENMNFDQRDSDSEEYGRFYYRFDHGESGNNVYDRVSDFMSTLNRDFEKKDFPDNVLLVSHGLTMRLFIMRWFHTEVADFETWKNPQNGEIWKMELNKFTNKYDFDFNQIKIKVPKHNFLRKLKV